MPIAIFLIVEIIFFIIVANFIGWGWALLLIIIGSLSGIGLLRIGNLHMAQKLQQKMMSGENMSTQEMMEFPFRMIAGFLLFIPGFITDIMAIICLIPSARRVILRYIMRHRQARPWSQIDFGVKTRRNDRQPPANDNGHTIEGEFWRDDEKNKKDRPK